MFRFKIPSQLESLLHIQGRDASLQTHSKPEISLLVWNVYKGKFGQRWAEDFIKLAVDNDLLLLQEAMTSEEMLDVFKIGLNVYHWHFAASFEYRNKHQTGVITGARLPTLTQHFVRGEERELGVFTPKVTLFTQYQLETQQLLVINIHAINFTSTNAFVSFISRLVEQISHHQGPLIFAGDFNTWNRKRWSELVRILGSMGLKEVVFEHDPRFLKLDHVFIRGLEVKSAKILTEVSSSDHFPLKIELIIP